MDFRFSEWFWEKLAKEFYWHPFTLALYYFNHLLQSDQNAQVSDTTEDHSSNTADPIKAFKEELEKQYPLQGMKPNRFRQQGANWSFTNYTQPLLSENRDLKSVRNTYVELNNRLVEDLRTANGELQEAKKEIERLKSQLDTVKKQWGIFDK